MKKTAFFRTAGWGLLLAAHAAVLPAAPPPSAAQATTAAATPAASAMRPGRVSATYYVRTDGGSATQCDGRSDTPLRAGGGSHCAWRHPMIALPPGVPARIAGGDTLLIAPGSYMMGLGAPGTEACSENWPWDCTMAPIPSGPDESRPTRILGQGHDGTCTAPPQLWGTERAASVLSLVGTRHAQVACLEITDREGCAVFHSGSLKCQRDRFPYGQWAVAGIVATDSSDVQLSRLDIHGLANAGIQAGRLSNWTLSKVRLAGNGWVGWDGDVGAKTSGNSGLMRFSDVDVEWNGCPETVADRRPAGCWGQSGGGYGDGLGTAETGGTWVIEDSRFRYNTQDGLDLLYHSAQGSVTLRRVWAEGNAGNQIKVAGSAIVENSVIVANCGFFKGQPFTHSVDVCRAFGDAAALVAKAPGELLTFINNTVISEGNTVLTFSGMAGSQLIARNNVFVGRPNALSPGKQSADVYAVPPTSDDAVTDDHNLKIGLRNSACRGSGNVCLPAGTAVMVNDTPGRVDPRPVANSPALAGGMPVGGAVPADDLYRKPRPANGAAVRGAVGVAVGGVAGTAAPAR